MFTTANGSRRSVFHMFLILIESHPASVFGQGSAPHAASLPEDLLDQMPAHLRDDLGLPASSPTAPEHPAIVRARNRASRWGS